MKTLLTANDIVLDECSPSDVYGVGGEHVVDLM
jgi:hypothetical protein